MIRPGDTFEGYDDRRHLYLVLSEPTNNNLAIANLISHYPHLPLHGPGCLVIRPDEHPWVRRDSCVFYQEAVLERCLILEADLDSAELQTHPPFTPQLLRRVQLGALASPFVAVEVKAAIRSTLADSP